MIRFRGRLGLVRRYALLGFRRYVLDFNVQAVWNLLLPSPLKHGPSDGERVRVGVKDLLRGPLVLGKRGAVISLLPLMRDK